MRILARRNPKLARRMQQPSYRQNDSGGDSNVAERRDRRTPRMRDDEQRRKDAGEIVELAKNAALGNLPDDPLVRNGERSVHAENHEEDESAAAAPRSRRVRSPTTAPASASAQTLQTATSARHAEPIRVTRKVSVEREQRERCDRLIRLPFDAVGGLQQRGTIRNDSDDRGQRERLPLKSSGHHFFVKSAKRATASIAMMKNCS